MEDLAEAQSLIIISQQIRRSLWEADSCFYIWRGCLWGTEAFLSTGSPHSLLLTAGLDGSALTQQCMVYPQIASTVQVEPPKALPHLPRSQDRASVTSLGQASAGDLLPLGDLGTVPHVKAGT